MRLIDADELLRKLPREELVSRIIVAGMPTIYPPNGYKVLADGRGWEYYGKEEAEPVRRGRWIHDGYDFQHGNDWIHCSECGKRGINVPADLTNYCPNCGAQMEEQEGD